MARKITTAAAVARYVARLVQNERPALAGVLRMEAKMVKGVRLTPEKFQAGLEAAADCPYLDEDLRNTLAWVASVIPERLPGAKEEDGCAATAIYYARLVAWMGDKDPQKDKIGFHAAIIVGYLAHRARL